MVHRGYRRLAGSRCGERRRRHLVARPIVSTPALNSNPDSSMPLGILNLLLLDHAC